MGQVVIVILYVGMLDNPHFAIVPKTGDTLCPAGLKTMSSHAIIPVGSDSLLSFARDGVAARRLFVQRSDESETLGWNLLGVRRYIITRRPASMTTTTMPMCPEVAYLVKSATDRRPLVS